MGYLQIRDGLCSILKPTGEMKGHVPKFNTVEYMGDNSFIVTNLKNFNLEESNDEFLIMTAVNFSMEILKSQILDVLNCIDVNDSFQLLLKNGEYIKVRYDDRNII